MLITAAVILDLLFGDPRQLPHPVIHIGKWIERIEVFLERWLGLTKISGLILWLIVVTSSFLLSFGLIYLAFRIHPILGFIVEIYFIWVSMAAKSLREAGLAVYLALAADDIELARKKVGEIVGRDTDTLDEPEITRATVETVAENIVDGVIAPLFFAAIGGGALAFAYRAVNTLDSMVGYRNERYQHFGWFSARMDDWWNLIPARITGILILFCSFLFPETSPKRAWQTWRRDAAKHPSPNSGIPESTIAGALGIQLGGLNYYQGVPSNRAKMGEPTRSLHRGDILTVNRFLYAVVILAMLFYWTIKLIIF